MKAENSRPFLNKRKMGNVGPRNKQKNSLVITRANGRLKKI